MLGPLTVICLGIIGLFVFFAALGGISPGEVVGLTIVVGVLALLLLVRALVVRHELAAGGDHSTSRSVHALRERRGF
jgi:hypothetical protein